MIEQIDRRRNLVLKKRIKVVKYSTKEAYEGYQNPKLDPKLAPVNSSVQESEITEDLLDLESNPDHLRRDSFRKFTECTICLNVFKDGEPVKLVPGCNHVFHEGCFNDWTAQKWRCPNCNTDIVLPGMEGE